ncbi:MAG: DUF3187 family protein [Acidobacteriota bacterium]
MIPVARSTASALLLAATTVSAGEPVMPGTRLDWTSSEAVGLGPLILRPQSPLSILRYAPIPLAPATTERGTWNVGTVWNWDNYFAVDAGGRFVIDAESFGITVGASYGLTERVDVNVSLPVSYRGGGVLDAFVENFEETFGVANEVRTEHPRGRYMVRLVGEDGTVFERTGDDSGWGVEDLTLGLRYQLTQGSGTRPAVLVFTGFKLPFGREASLRSSGGTDIALGVAAGQRLGRFHLYGSLTGIHFTTTEIAGIQLTQHQWSLFTGVEFRASSRTSWLLQSNVTSPAARRFGDFAKRTYEVALGFKRLVGTNLMFEASVLENLFVFENSPDVGFHVGFVWRPDRRGP